MLLKKSIPEIAKNSNSNKFRLLPDY